MHFQNKYIINIKNIIKTENDTLCHFSFSAIDLVNSFNGELFYFKRQNRVEKIKLNSNSVKDPPLCSLRDPEKDKISRLRYSIEVGYVFQGNKNIISYINFDRNFNLKAGKKTDTIQTNMKLINFDFGKSFFQPFYPEIDYKCDYKKVASFPCKASLFENNVFLKEGKNEIFIRKLFDTLKCYNSTLPDESILFLPKRFQRWSPDWLLDVDLIGEDYNPEVHIRYGNNYLKSKKAKWDSVFAYNFIFLDYDCHDKSPTFSASRILDYKCSFFRAKSDNKNDSVNRDYLKLYLNNCQSISITLKEFLEKKYRNRCPLEEELRVDYKKFTNINIVET